MAYSVDWTGKQVTIPVSDLVLVSGTEYNLSMSSFHKEIRRLESAFDEGLWAPQILDHTNAKTLSGVPFAPLDEIINGYQIQFGSGPTRVNLVGSNNNIIDVLIVTGISVVPSNSAGLVVYEDERIQQIHAAHWNRRKHDKTANTVTIYAADGTTPLKVFDAPDDLSELTPQ